MGGDVPDRQLLAYCSALAILVLACGSTPGPTSSLPPPALTALISPTPPAGDATGQPTATPASRPTDEPTMPIPTPSATPFDYRGWIPLSSGGLLANRFLAWSPDGQHILIVRRSVNAPASSQFVDVFDRDGTLVQTFAGYDDAVWLDSDRVVLSIYERNGASGEIVLQKIGVPEATSFVARLGSDGVEAVDANLADARPNGQGALAVETCWICRQGVGWYREAAYQIWTMEGGLTAKQQGLPYQWSKSGDRLLVEHPLQSGPTRDSRWEIVSWPGLDRYAQGDGVLDADFERSARWRWSGAGQPTRVEVADLATGQHQSFEDPYEGGNAAWDSSGRLVLTDYETGNASAHALDGSVLERWDRVGNYISSSADHSTLVFWYWDQVDGPQFLSVLREGGLSRVATPVQFSVGFDAVHVSPDGTAMVIVSVIGSNLETALLFRL